MLDTLSSHARAAAAPDVLKLSAPSSAPSTTAKPTSADAAMRSAYPTSHPPRTSSSEGGDGGVPPAGGGFGIVPPPDSFKKYSPKWDPRSGLSLGGRNVRGAAAKLGTLAAAADSAVKLDQLSKSRKSADDTIGAILRTANSDPYTAVNLTPEQNALLRKLRNNPDYMDAGANDVDFTTTLTGAVPGAVIGGTVGGVPGAVVGSVLSAIPSAIGSVTSTQDRKNAELEALLNALETADVERQQRIRDSLYKRY